MNASLASIVDNHFYTLMLYIRGVRVVDTVVANHLIKIKEAAALMGHKTIDCGISHRIA